MKINPIKDALMEYLNTITWDNWIEEGKEIKKDDKDPYYLGGQVLFNQLEWMKENYDIKEDDEFGILIEEWQTTICPLLNLIENTEDDGKAKIRTKEIYDELSGMLTDWEGYGVASSMGGPFKRLYEMLVKIQNSWEAIIAANEQKGEANGK